MQELGIEKKVLRRRILGLRRRLTEEEIAAESAAVLTQVKRFLPYRQANILMCYAAMPDEVQTRAVIEAALQEGKKVCVPYVENRKGMMAAAYTERYADLVAGEFGILAPDPKKLHQAAPHEIDLILLPGVAFTIQGARLGMGSGFYDRFLSKAPQAAVAGLALACQVVEKIPCESHDQAADFLITAKGIVDCKTILS